MSARSGDAQFSFQSDFTVTFFRTYQCFWVEIGSRNSRKLSRSIGLQPPWWEGYREGYQVIPIQDILFIFLIEIRAQMNN